MACVASCFSAIKAWLGMPVALHLLSTSFFVDCRELVDVY